MSINYDKHSWAYGEEITPDKLNNVENGIKANADAINEVNNNLPIKSIIIDTGATGKTLKDILASMQSNTICYIDYITRLLAAEKDALIVKGFSQYTSVELLKINEWCERVILISTNGNKVGIWYGNKNTDILSTMRVL